MENKQAKCIKGKTCLYCGSNYCQYVDEVKQLKAENEKLNLKLQDYMDKYLHELAIRLLVHKILEKCEVIDE